jgi:adenylate kinase
MSSALGSEQRRLLPAGATSVCAYPPLVVLAGPPGAGKGTQCSNLVEHLDMVHVSIGDTLRQEVEDGTPLGSRIRSCLEAGRLVPDCDVSEVVAERLARHRAASAVLLDGFPRTLGQAEMLERIRPSSVGLVVLLVVPLATVHRRLCDRGRADDGDLDVVAERMLAYDRDTRPVLAWYASRGLLAHIDGNAPMREVTARIEGQLDAFGLGCLRVRPAGTTTRARIGSGSTSTAASSQSPTDDTPSLRGAAPQALRQRPSRS